MNREYKISEVFDLRGDKNQITDNHELLIR